jgi:hypothetical protein
VGLEVLVDQVVPLLAAVVAQVAPVPRVQVHLHRVAVLEVRVKLQALPVHLLFMLLVAVVVSMEHPILQTVL